MRHKLGLSRELFGNDAARRDAAFVYQRRNHLLRCREARHDLGGLAGFVVTTLYLRFVVAKRLAQRLPPEQIRGDVG